MICDLDRFPYPFADRTFDGLRAIHVIEHVTDVVRTMEEFQLDLPAKYTEHCDASGGYHPDNLDWEAIATEIKELREKIHRLGNVNLDAINEMDELEQRSTFLTNQVTDLTGDEF